MDTFYVTGMEKSPFAALYKGNMRGKDSEEVRGGPRQGFKVWDTGGQT